MSIRSRPPLVDVPPTDNLARVVEMTNSNFRRLREGLYGIDGVLDSALTALTKRVTSLEAAGFVPLTAAPPSGVGGGGAIVPITEITPNTVTVTLAGASVTASDAAPVNSLLFSVQVTITGMTGATSLDAGITNHVDKFGRGLTTTGDITTFTFLNPGYISGAALDVLLTARGGNFTSGTANVRAHYWQVP